ncbi:MAG: winged helix-turn-helix domain-containing protein, partial [Thermoproteota archaeon]|nr:winged helix-turn-helix domain-containing protein [Thermoproteota archaeon]
CNSKEQICPYSTTIVSAGEIETGPQYEGVLSSLFSSRAVSQIMDFFLDHKEFDYSPGEIAKKTGLSFRTIFRELPHLEKNQIIYISRKIGKTNMYRLNTDFEAVTFLEKFVFEMSQLQNKESDAYLKKQDILNS